MAAVTILMDVYGWSYWPFEMSQLQALKYFKTLGAILKKKHL